MKCESRARKSSSLAPLHSPSCHFLSFYSENLLPGLRNLFSIKSITRRDAERKKICMACRIFEIRVKFFENDLGRQSTGPINSLNPSRNNKTTREV